RGGRHEDSIYSAWKPKAPHKKPWPLEGGAVRQYLATRIARKCCRGRSLGGVHEMIESLYDHRGERKASVTWKAGESLLAGAKIMNRTGQSPVTKREPYRCQIVPEIGTPSFQHLRNVKSGSFGCVFPTQCAARPSNSYARAQ